MAMKINAADIDSDDIYEEIDDSILSAAISDVFRKCNTCFKPINKNESYIIAYKNGHPAYFCREHINDAGHYLDWFEEIVELKGEK